ncbi:RRM domain-containing protein [Mycena indigotica]|uniref:RRM domain-containing protein n=1 Tax=Mycena indigotica TaxID=2126181 RepID=A0A8H6SNJ5_9AGAR|nr:RRM domain-containing protein [Mycena indigotica]KAF7302130.1 RRM domain-containing protein [Mycena indigotica]
MLATDSALLNKSLLDQLDAQADAEPLTSSDDSSAESPPLKMATPFYPNRASFTAFPNTNRAPTRNFFPPDSFGLQHYPYAPPPTSAPTQPVMHSQTPYGPHVPSSIPIASAPPMIPPAQEDISTIFVVGFPEDMQEREFQNMFTFSPGFEAATLKIPNKEYTAYGLPPMGPPQPLPQQRALGAGGQYNGYTGSNDPYNLVTVNQGGVVVDAGRDGITSWPAPPDDPTGNHNIAPSGPYPPRKQIIGFAKFRTREEALGARDVLQGRRIDIEKGAVLKAEMAKKNLHTKRGVGPVAAPGLPPLNGNNVGPSTMPMMGAEMYDPLSPRERDSVGLATMGIANNVNGNTNGVRLQWRPEDELDENGNMMPTMMMRGARERVADDEAERLRRRERDRRAGAFESLAANREREREHAEQQAAVAGPWGIPGRRPSSPESATGHDFVAAFGNEAPRALSSPPPTAMLQPPGEFVPGRYVPNGILNGHHSSYLPHHDAFQPQHPFLAHRQERSDSSASEGSGGSDEGLARMSLRNGINGYHVTAIGPRVNGTSSAGSASGSSKGSPQLGESVGTGPNGLTAPAPTSAPLSSIPTAASIASLTQLNTSTSILNNGPTNVARAVDQNPPINTLYVGNLPSGGAGIEYLEAALRELFTSCPGFRQMSFRPKANGPMCFVEFEDVGFATKTLNELYGNTLNGMIKGGGIRLSYSKNPFGVRTPTSASATTSMATLQIQQSVAAVQQQQAGMVQQQPHHHQQHSMAAAEAAFHGHANGLRLTSPPPIPVSIPSLQQVQPQPPPQGEHLSQAHASFIAGPRFFAPPENGVAGSWGRRWETPRSVAGGVSATGLVSPPPTATFAPFTPPELPPGQGEHQ